MSHDNLEHGFNSKPQEYERMPFLDKLKELVPGVEFEESDELREARVAVLEALRGDNQDPDFLRSVWVEYTTVLEQVVDDMAPRGTIHQVSGPIEIAALVHKALIYREIRDRQRYGEDLTAAEDYAITRHYKEIAEALTAELNGIAN